MSRLSTREAHYAQYRKQRPQHSPSSILIASLPDQRFEVAYLQQIARRARRRSDLQSESTGSSNVASALGFGPDVTIDLKSLLIATFHDQIFSPMYTGAVWTLVMLAFNSSVGVLRAGLWPSYVPHGRIAGGPGGSIEQAGGAEAVGGTWWRKWAGSILGGLETATV